MYRTRRTPMGAGRKFPRTALGAAVFAFFMALSIRYPSWRPRTSRSGHPESTSPPESPGAAQSSGLVQAALDLLSARIAILDDEGTIVAVNQAWRRFVEEGEASELEHGVGAKYLELAKGPLQHHLSEGAQQIQEVLEG